MNQFAIFGLLAFFHISYAPAQAETRRPIREAWVNNRTDHGLKVFKEGEVYLEEVTSKGDGQLRYFVARDNSDQDCPKFPIGQYATVVTDDRITMKWGDGTTINLFVNDGDTTFKFYERLFPLKNFPHTFDVTMVIQDGKPLKGVTAIKAKKAEYNSWFFVFLKGDTPRLIIPKSVVKLSNKEYSEDEVIIVVSTNLDTTVTVIKVYFDDFEKANNFCEFFNKL